MYSFFRKINFNNSVPSCSTINTIKKSSNSLIILGNGPSLKFDLNSNMDYINKYDCMAVNHFCETEAYLKVKPKFYLLVDPDYFGNFLSYEVELKNKIENFINLLVNRTTWEMSLILPDYSNNSLFLESISKNTKIKVFYFCNREYDFKYADFKNWDLNITTVPSQTCINTCLYLGIFLRYEKIFLIGVDTNWIHEIEVDQKTNQPYLLDEHFYSKRKMVLYKNYKTKKDVVMLHEQLYNEARVFEYYWDLKKYSEYANVKVYNASKYSMIDAFERSGIF